MPTAAMSHPEIDERIFRRGWRTFTGSSSLLLKSSTLTDEQKEEMKEELKVIYKYDQFIDENPDVQERVERGITQGIAQGMQRLILDAVKERFPALADQAQPLIERIQDTGVLETLFRHLLTATTERDVRCILQIQEKQ